jgi:hypothetical protein
MTAFCTHLEELGLDVSLMWVKIYDIIIKSLLCIESETKQLLRKNNVHRNNCYELLGYDIILDTNFTYVKIQIGRLRRKKI